MRMKKLILKNRQIDIIPKVRNYGDYSWFACVFICIPSTFVGLFRIRRPFSQLLLSWQSETTDSSLWFKMVKKIVMLKNENMCREIEKDSTRQKSINLKSITLICICTPLFNRNVLEFVKLQNIWLF